MLRYGVRVKNADFDQRYKALQSKGRLSSNVAEKITGAALIFCLVFFIRAKYDDETMIFMLNPCHVTALLQAVCCFCPFNKWTEFVALTSFAFNFGGWIGIIFPELDGYTQAEVVVYYV